MVLTADSILSAITIEGVRQRLSRLNKDKAVGGDGIHPAILKNCAKSLSRPLFFIFAKTIVSKEVLRDWKNANITPIFKRGSKLEAVNYRPVSLTSVVCKVMEGIIRDVLMKYLISNNLISKEQHGFVPKRCCTTNLLETLDMITRCDYMRTVWMKYCLTCLKHLIKFHTSVYFSSSKPMALVMIF